MSADRGTGRRGWPGRHPGHERHGGWGRADGGPAPAIRLRAGTGPKPVAVVPDALRGSRGVEAATTTIVAIDHSGSVGSTDPDDARIHDARFSMAWAERNMRDDDRLVLVGFTDAANATAPLTATEAREAVEAGEPRPAGGGGTAFLPIADAVGRLVGDPEHSHLVLVTDGMSGDVAAFAAAVAQAGLRTTLVPFGSDWPFVKANWEHADHIRLAAHVSDQPLAIARALAHTMLELTGQSPRAPRRRRNAPRGRPGSRGRRLRRLFTPPTRGGRR